jgi:hypothetical protein
MKLATDSLIKKEITILLISIRIKIGSTQNKCVSIQINL